MRKLFVSIVMSLMLFASTTFAFNFHIENDLDIPLMAVLYELIEVPEGYQPVEPPVDMIELMPGSKVVAEDLDDSKLYGLQVLDPLRQVVAQGGINIIPPTKDCLNIKAMLSEGLTCMDNTESKK